jgi:hypothetical protein
MEPIWGDVLQAFQNGVQLDLRVRLAVDFLKAWPAATPEAALDAATRLLDLAAERGLMKPLPEDNELSTPLRRHMERNVRAQVHSQLAGQKIQAEEASPLDTRPISVVPRRQ